MSVVFSRPNDEAGETDEGRLEIACDGPKCSVSETFWGAQFSDAMSEAKVAGWRNIPDGDGGYRNLCGVCSRAHDQE